MYSVQDNHLMMAGFPHSDISGSKSVCRLPEAFRRLPRLSSPLTAKASTVCASSLDHITPSNLVILWRRHSPKIRISQLRELTNFTLAWSVTSESNVQSIFLSHTQIFKERTSQRLEINIHHRTVECSFLSFQTSEAVVVEPNGIEPLTSCVQGRRSSQLS